MLASANFKKVGELRDKDWNVNIFGVVKYFQAPKKTQKTGDHYMMMTLIDDSVDDVEAGVRCQIFEKNAAQLPKVTQIGDVVLLKQVKVNMFNGRLQVQRTSNFQWVVFGTKKNASGNHVVQSKSTSLLAPTMKQPEQSRLKELLQFLGSMEKKIIESESVADNDNVEMLSSLAPGTYVDIVGQVVGISMFKNKMEKAALLKLSDGSKVTYSSLYQMGQVEERDTETLELATAGHTCEISVFDDHVDSLGDVRVGDFVKIVNLHVKAVSRQLLVNWKLETQGHGPDSADDWRELVVHSGTKYNRGIRKLSPNETCITQVKDRLGALVACYTEANAAVDGIVSQIEANEFSSRVLCTNDYPSKPFTSISDILTQQSSHSRRFRIRARVLKVHPVKFTDIIVGKCTNCNTLSRPFSHKENSISTICTACKTNSIDVTFFLRLLLEDDTGLITVMITGEDADHFFGDTTPSELVGDQGRMSRFEDALRTLGGDVSSVLNVNIAKERLLKSDSVVYRMLGTQLITSLLGKRKIQS